MHARLLPDEAAVLQKACADVVRLAEAGCGPEIPSADAGARDSADHRETFERLACECGIWPSLLDADGNTIDEGRAKRLVTPALRRALVERDGPTCGFPGCGRRHGLTAHHIEPWSQGGETSLENLLYLCKRDHRAVHEGGFAVERGSEGFVFRSPRGRVLDPSPPRPPRPSAVAADAGAHVVEERIHALLARDGGEVDAVLLEGGGDGAAPGLVRGPDDQQGVALEGAEGEAELGGGEVGVALAVDDDDVRGAGAGDLPQGAVQSRTDFGTPGFGGACPPPGEVHRYEFTVHAIAAERLELGADAPAAMVGFMTNARALDSATVTAVYTR